MFVCFHRASASRVLQTPRGSSLTWDMRLTDVISLRFFCFRIIYKCSMCDTVFTLQTLLYRHFDQHIENQKVSVFKCPDCSLLYAQKQLMMDHIKVCVHLSSPLKWIADTHVGISQGWAGGLLYSMLRCPGKGCMLVVCGKTYMRSACFHLTVGCLHAQI